MPIKVKVGDERWRADFACDEAYCILGETQYKYAIEELRSWVENGMQVKLYIVEEVVKLGWDPKNLPSTYYDQEYYYIPQTDLVEYDVLN